MNNTNVNSQKATFVVYIDESGDEGFRFSQGSSQWFVLSAIITRKVNDVDTVKLVDEVRVKLNKPAKKHLHFKDLRHEHRLPYIDRIAKADLQTVSILVHKPSIDEPEKFMKRYQLYFHAVRHLFERVSWYCRDHGKPQDDGDGTAEIIFSNRSSMSYDELKNYLQVLKNQTNSFDAQIDWNAFKIDTIAAYSAGKRMGLQIADAVAGSFFYAVEPSKYGYTEDRYAKMLRPVVYQSMHVYREFGLKFWPDKVNDILKTDEHFEWLRREYAYK